MLPSINMNTTASLAAHEPSICIPRVEAGVTDEQILAAFESVLGRGSVDAVDLVPWRGEGTNGKRRAFIHLTKWPDTPVGTQMRNRFLEGGEIKLVHSDPWFWRCAKSRVPRPQKRGFHSGGAAPELIAALAEGGSG